jgi:hypothetical protein
MQPRRIYGMLLCEEKIRARRKTAKWEVDAEA